MTPQSEPRIGFDGELVTEPHTTAHDKPSSLIEETTAATPDSPMSQLKHRNLRSVDTSLDTTTLQGRMRLANAMGPQALSLFDQPVIRLMLVGWVVYRDVVVDEQTGEVREVTRTVLLGKDGRNLMTTAAHMPSRLRAIADLFTPEEINTGIPVVASVEKGRRKRDYHDLRLDMDAK